MKKKYNYLKRIVLSKKSVLSFVLRHTFTLLLVFSLIGSISAQNNAKTFNLKLQNADFKEVIKKIQAKSNFTFLYNHEEVEKLDNVNVDVKGGSIEDVLTQSLANTKLGFKIQGDIIIISPKIDSPQLPIEIKGKITDKDGYPLIGATILEKGTNNGTISDPDGNYTLKVAGTNSILVVSYIGFETKQVLVGEKEIINFTLTPSSKNLEEFVVVGYGSIKKERIGCSVSQLNVDDIEDKSAGALSFEEILGGQIKGVQIIQSDGTPGSNAVFRIRGVTSPFMLFGNNQPLFVIDGVPFNTDAQFDTGGYLGASQNPLLSISPNDIESFTVLKDAAATAIYGSRGANGVILITTKRGKKNTKIRTTIDYSLSINNPIKKLKLLDADGFKELHTMIAQSTLDAYTQGTASSSSYNQAALIIDPVTGQLKETVYDMASGQNIPIFGNSNTNWQDQVYRKNAPAHQWNINISGGDKSTNFSLGLSYTDQKPLVKNSRYKRYGVRLGIDSEVNKWLKAGSSINYSGVRDFSSHQAGSDIIRDVFTMRPDYSVYDNAGSFQRYPAMWMVLMPGMVMVTEEGPNPMAMLENEITNHSTSFIGNAYAEASIFKGFKLRADINTALFKVRGRNFKPLRATSLSSILTSSTSTLTNSISENLNTSLNFQAIYHKTIEKHNFDAMAGVSWDKSSYYRNYVNYWDLVDDYVLTNAASANTVYESGEGKAKSGINSFYSRWQYSYDGKYTATFNFRSDKSSKFGPGNKVAYFPSIAVNWNIDREEFIKKAEFINKLIFRGSYGKSGSSNIQDFEYMQFFEVGTFTDNEYDLGDPAIVPSSTFPNTNIRWETTKELNFGIDFSLFSNHLYGSFDIYSKYTDGILIASPFPLESGATNYTSNLAEVSNKGWEFELGIDIIRTADINWSVSLNIAANRNKVENMEGNSLEDYQTDYFTVGEPVGVIKGYRAEKIIQSQEEIDALNAASPTGVYYEIYTAPGDYLYKDINGDGRITIEDKQVIGGMQPDYFGGFSALFRYKRFSLNANFQFSIGNESSWNNYGSLIGNVGFLQNGLEDALYNTWTPERTNATHPRLIYGNSYNTVMSDAIVQDASFLRLKSLRLNYNIPEIIVNKLSLKNASVYVSASNLFTITNFKGIDPEAGGGAILGSLDNRDTYPYAKTVSFGVKIGL